MSWKFNYAAALYFVVLAVVAFFQANWVWLGIDSAAAVGSVILAEKVRRRERRREVEMVRSLMQPSPFQDEIDKMTKENDGRAHQAGDQDEADTVGDDPMDKTL